MATTDEELYSDERPRRSVLSRSQSLPHLSHHDSGLGSYYGVRPYKQCLPPTVTLDEIALFYDLGVKINYT